MSLPPSPIPPGVTLDLVVGRSANWLTLAGELDLLAARRMDRVLRRLEILDRPLVVGLARVRFADSHGLEPLVESARRRGGGLRLEEMPPCVERVLTALALLPLFDDAR